MVTLVLPRVRDFSGLTPRKFDGHWNYNIGFTSQVVFPEVTPEEVQTPMGLQVNINTTTDNDEEAKLLLKKLGIIFQ
jgi:large subunit ribosomal protein L5